MESMDARLVAQALNYHGQQLQKVWEGERNENELVMLNLKDPSFEIYQQRQKTLRYISVVLMIIGQILNTLDSIVKYISF